MGAKSLLRFMLWASDLLQYYDHIHQNKKHTCHLRMWGVFHIIHHIFISLHFIRFKTLRANFCSQCPNGHSSVLVRATSHNSNKCWSCPMAAHGAGIIPGTCQANELWRYMATPSLTDQTHSQNDPWWCHGASMSSGIIPSFTSFQRFLIQFQKHLH